MPPADTPHEPEAAARTPAETGGGGHPVPLPVPAPRGQRSVPLGSAPRADQGAIRNIGGIGANDFARVIEASGDALVVLDVQWRYAYVNGPAEAVIGKPSAELLGRAVTDIFPGFDGTPFWAVYQEAVRDQVFLTVEEFFEPLGRWFHVRAVPLGGMLYLHFRDVTARKEAEERERTSAGRERARLIDIFMQAPAFMAVLRGPKHVFEMVNPPYLQLVGHRGDLIGRPVVEALPEVVEQGFIGLLDSVYHTGEPFVGTDVPILLQRTPAGPREERFLDFTYQPLRDTEGNVNGILAHGIDLTERKRAEDALRASEERYRTLVESMDEGFCLLQIILDDHGLPRDYRFLEANAAFVRQAGFAPTIGKTGRELTPDLDEFWYETYGRVALTGEPTRFENHAPALGRWFDVYALRVGPAEERKVGVLFSDITARKRAEEALRGTAGRLRESQERLELAFASVHLGMWELDLRTGEQVWSGEQERLFGLPRGGFGGSVGSFLDGVHPDDRERVAAYARRAFANPDTAEYEDEFRVVRPDTGEVRWLYGRARIERDPATGEALRVTGVNLDITERKRVEEELRRAAERGAVLSRLNTVLRSTFAPDEIERAAVTILGEALGVDRCYMVSYHVAENYSTVACEYRSRPDALSPMAGRYTISDFGAVMEGLYRSPEPQVVADVRQSDLGADAVAKMEALGMRAYVRVPLYQGGTVVSGIGVAMADAPRAWTQGEVELVQTAAAQVRAVLEAARAHKRLEQAEAKQRRIAETLQNAMLLAPPEDAFTGLRVGTHYEPAWDEALVGGDFYDALQLDGGRVALICGDGTGKGLEAARYVSESLFVLRAYLRESPDPAAALTRLNSYMIDGQRFDGRSENALAAVVVAVIDTRTGEARFAAGGAEPPLVVRAATGRAEPVEVSGVVLGANPKTEYESSSVALNPDDLVVLTTDGTTEARNRRTRQFFGYEGVLRAAEKVARATTGPLDDAALLVVERAKEYAGGRLGDDACVVIARFTGGATADSPE